MNNIQNKDQRTNIMAQIVGVEVEMTGGTRRAAARIVAGLFESTVRHPGGYYDKYKVSDARGRDWTFMSDGSVTEDPESVELVTPELQMSELWMVRLVLDKLREEGFYADESCGVHVHVSTPDWDHNLGTLRTLLRMGAGREALIKEALGVTREREHWCVSVEIADKLDSLRNEDALWDLWYSEENPADRYGGWSDREEHYNSTRYHGINLHSLYQGKGVEFRYFNGTVDSDSVIAYIHLGAALQTFAINCPDEPIKFYNERELDYTKSQKKTLFRGFLTKRLGMSGADFSKTRKILLQNFA